VNEEPIPPEVQAAMAPFIAALEALQVRYYIGGSVAAMVWSRPRLTQDTDLIVDLALDQVAALVARLEAEYYVDPEAVREAIQRRAAFNAIHFPTGLKLDIYIPAQTAWTAVNFAHAVATPAGVVASPANTVLQKLRWYRMGGEVSERQWRDLVAVLHAQGAGLDRTYLQHWAGQLGVADLLQRALDEAGLV